MRRRGERQTSTSTSGRPRWSDALDAITQRGLPRREVDVPVRIGVDDASFQQRHEYATAINDLDGMCHPWPTGATAGVGGVLPQFDTCPPFRGTVGRVRRAEHRLLRWRGRSAAEGQALRVRYPTNPVTPSSTLIPEDLRNPGVTRSCHAASGGTQCRQLAASNLRYNGVN